MTDLFKRLLEAKKIRETEMNIASNKIREIENFLKSFSLDKSYLIPVNEEYILYWDLERKRLMFGRDTKPIFGIDKPLIENKFKYRKMIVDAGYLDKILDILLLDVKYYTKEG